MIGEDPKTITMEEMEKKDYWLLKRERKHGYTPPRVPVANLELVKEKDAVVARETSCALSGSTTWDEDPQNESDDDKAEDDLPMFFHLKTRHKIKTPYLPTSNGPVWPIAPWHRYDLSKAFERCEKSSLHMN
ncbi:uncharacterized protein SCHCODRAFT_02668216 [Schizophyllum commune H4-8]|nr:uncharacterized protein SCHCODRAFT_02668216 [Schizophyllum commune H4-8]KAI5892809.1 hypothetical protein SCHCODRAFT_02668216 [Schizophyllum commune H4-8]